jgi:hypothetical protein
VKRNVFYLDRRKNKELETSVDDVGHHTLRNRYCKKMRDWRNMVGEAFHRAPEKQDVMKPEGEGLTLGLDSGSQKGC